MKTVATVLASVLAWIAGMPSGHAQTKPGIERMYVLYCGEIALNERR